MNEGYKKVGVRRMRCNVATIEQPLAVTLLVDEV